MRTGEPKTILYVFREEGLQAAAADYVRRCCLSLAPEEAETAAKRIDEAQSELFQVRRTEFGKPYFVNCPQLHFSISHSGAYWVCVLADEEIGVDLQEHVRFKEETTEAAAIRFRKMAHRFFHPLEAEFVDAKSCDEGTECFSKTAGLKASYGRFFDTWAAREAYVKYTGQGIDRTFSEHCVVPADKEAWSGLGENRHPVSWEAQGVWFTKQCYRDTYSLCICAKNRKELEIVEFL